MSVSIFISCVSDEFGALREKLRRELTGRDIEVKIQEDFNDYGGATIENVDDYIRGCDVVVHLVGGMMGAIAPPASAEAILKRYSDFAGRLPELRSVLERRESISYTQWEAWLAIYHCKRLLIVQPACPASRQPAFQPDEKSCAAQRAHLGRLKAMDRHPRPFADGHQLVSQVFHVISDVKERGASQRWTGSYLAVVVGLLILMATPLIAEEWAKTLGVSAAAPLALIVAAGSFALPLIFSRYFMMLGASDAPAGSRDRQGYDSLRESLATGGIAVRLYTRWLTAFLDRVDRFFGDAGMADRTLLPHAFGLRTPAPLWTAAAFDRCLLLALLYPILTIVIMWAVSGHVGPAEARWGLNPSLPGLERGLMLVPIGFGAFAIRRFRHTSGWISVIWLTGAAIAVAVVFARVFAGSIALGQAVTYAFVVAFAVAMAFTDTGAGALAVTVAFAVANVFIALLGSALIRATESLFIHAFTLAFAAAFAVGGAPAVAAAIAAAQAVSTYVFPAVSFGVVAAVPFILAFVFAVAVSWLNNRAIRSRRQGLFLLSLVFAITSGCFAAVHFLAPQDIWIAMGSELLFLVWLPLLNCPFDWASLGLTRALLRRGLELKGWWPFVLAVADSVAAAVVIALLTLTIVIGVQTLDALAVHHAGTAVLPLAPLLDGIADHPEAPEYWWVYALLLSTMIPSLVNLAIGGTALMRAVPGLPSLLLHFLPAGGRVPAYDRAWIAAVLTLQSALGAALGIAIQTLVAWVLIFHIMPAVGLGLLDLARGLAALDLPMRLIGFLGA